MRVALCASDGGIFSSGDAGFHGSTGNLRLNKPAVGMAAAPDGKGYWFVASDGGVFNYGSWALQAALGGPASRTWPGTRTGSDPTVRRGNEGGLQPRLGLSLRVVATKSLVNTKCDVLATSGHDICCPSMSTYGRQSAGVVVD